MDRITSSEEIGLREATLFTHHISFSVQRNAVQRVKSLAFLWGTLCKWLEFVHNLQIKYDLSETFIFSPADMFANEEGGPEPDWVITEREQFSDFRDLNKDGKMDKEEIQHWILPQDYDHALAEARHLVYESDVDKVLSVLVFILSYIRLWGFKTYQTARNHS